MLQEGSEEHYNWFESLISGRCLATNYKGVGDSFRRIFPAQVIKDCAMAATIRCRCYIFCVADPDRYVTSIGVARGAAAPPP